MNLRRNISRGAIWGPLAAGAGAPALVLIVASLAGPVSLAFWAAAGLGGIAAFAGLRAFVMWRAEPGAAEVARLLAAHSSEGVMRLGRDGRIRFACGRAAELLGRPALDLRRESITEFAAGAARAEVQAALARTSYFGAETSVVFRLRSGGEDAPWLELHCRPLFPDARQPAGEPAFEMVAMLRDVTAQKQIEAELRETCAELEAATRAKSDFIAGVSHELRTPLNAIIGFSEMMTAEMFGPLGNERYKEYAQHISESGAHLRDLINDVLDVSKVEAGRFAMELERVSVPQVFDETLKTVSVTAKNRKVALDVQFPANLPRVTADRRAVKQMLLNLLANAIKFTPEGGTVTAAARKAGARMVIEVRDTGIGIAKADLKRLAKPYEQIVRRRNESAADKGTGLGLALVKSFANLHGGTMEVESEEGQGTCVRVTLPLDGPRGATRDDEGTAPVDLANRRVA